MKNINKIVNELNEQKSIMSNYMIYYDKKIKDLEKELKNKK
jgi:hypothetical protein